MKNGDKPAYPVSDPDTARLWKEHQDESAFIGLTKREAFAMAAIDGAIGMFPHWAEEMDSGDYERIARHAVQLADCLLEELEK